MKAARRRIDLQARLLSSLGVLIVVAIYAHGPGNVLPQTLIAVTCAGLMDVALRRSITGARMFPTGALISGLIVALLLPAGQAWYLPLVAASLAIGSKHLLRRRGANIFNPAAFGVAATVLLFSSQLQYDHADYLEAAPRLYYAQDHLRMDGWSFVLQDGHGWSGSTSAVAVILLGGALVLRLKRMGLAISFLATHALLFGGFALVTGQDLVVRLGLEVFATGVPFFAFFMLTDPVSSPKTPRARVMYGAYTALLAFVLRFIASPVQFLLYALLVANVAVTISKTPGVPMRPRARFSLVDSFDVGARRQRR